MVDDLAAGEGVSHVVDPGVAGQENFSLVIEIADDFSAVFKRIGHSVTIERGRFFDCLGIYGIIRTQDEDRHSDCQKRFQHESNTGR